MAILSERAKPLADERGRILMLPLDHGISMGPVPGIVPMKALLEKVQDRITCITVHKGPLRRLGARGKPYATLMHLSASTDRGPDPDEKRLVGTVDEAMELGAAGVSIHINLGSRTEAAQLEDFGRVSTRCNSFRFPLIAMVYPRGPEIDDPFEPGVVAHAARLAFELGADAVKVPYTGDPDSFRDVVDGARIPVIVAGGPKVADFDAFLAQLRGAAEAGASGTSIGRNVFQSPDPGAAAAAIAEVFA